MLRYRLSGADSIPCNRRHPVLEHRPLPLLPALLAALLLCSAAEANDSAFGGRGSELIPLKETRIQMTSEDIVMTLKGSTWHIDATYVFTNPTDKPVTLQMGFPEEHCGEEQECMQGAGIFKGLVTRVRGEAVKQTVGQVDRKHEWAPELGRVYLYTVRFKPKEVVTIHHAYHHPTNTGIDGIWIDYVTRTGSLWNGPIGKARFTVRTPTRPWRASWPETFTLRSYVERPTGKPGEGQTEFVFEMADWTPRVDFTLMLLSGMNGPNHGCPMYDTMMVDPKNLKAEIAGQLKELTAAQLRVCRNLPYARHGYRFKDAKLNATFYAASKSGAGFAHGADPRSKERWTWQAFQVNPHFKPSLLTPTEQRYIQLIKAEEGRRAKP